MKILVVGGGGREHALCWKIAQSNIVSKLYCAPGNAGIARTAECVDLKPENIEGLAEFARREGIDLTVVGPEAPLVQGIADTFRERGLRIFGPDRKAARLEGSKTFCKTLLRQHGIPTASFRAFDDARSAAAHLKGQSYPVVIKADGLAAGKGVSICATEAEAEREIRAFMVEGKFGDAGRRIVIEEHLSGIEGSIMAIADGSTLLVLENTQDHKKLYEGEIGPNTGGMGAYSPVPAISAADTSRVIEKILVPAMHAMRREECPFAGVLYAGIMFTRAGPKVLEFNVRFGDPETQPLLCRLKSDLVPLLFAAAEGKLEGVDESQVEWDPRAAVTVVMASAGYPGRVEAGQEVAGLNEAEAVPHTTVFHAGTTGEGGAVRTAGGRVFGVTGLGETFDEARRRAYEACKKIRFKGAYFRNDIALRAASATSPGARV
jgi:phosphoribosylamine--glycine ligase